MDTWNAVPPLEGEFMGVGTLVPSGKIHRGIVEWCEESQRFTAKENGNFINLQMWRHPDSDEMEKMKPSEIQKKLEEEFHKIINGYVNAEVYRQVNKTLDAIESVQGKIFEKLEKLEAEYEGVNAE